MPTETATPLTGSLVRRLEARDVLTAEERTLLEEMFTQVRLVEAGSDIVSDGDHPSRSTLVVRGFAARYKVLADGQRQITALHLPGDFIDLHSFLLKPMDHGIAALSRCRVASVPHETLAALSVSEPHLTRLFWMLTLLDSALHREWLVALGRRSALGRLAHLLCELKLRLGVVGACEADSFAMPLTQVDLGDMLGLTSVHVSRVLRELRDGNYIVWKGAQVSITDWSGLRRLAEFDERYLHIVRAPR